MSADPPPSARPHRRSDSTKAAILAAARRRFIADGYRGATIRAIAADAHIDPAMVMRYFESKEKLFEIAAGYDLRLPDLTAVPAAEVGERLVRHLLDVWENDLTLLALMRTAVNDETAAAKMKDIFFGQTVVAVTRLCGDPESGARRAGLVATQVLGLVLCRYVLKLPPVAAMGAEELVSSLGPTMQRYILGDV